jgi:hypothetical protein
MTLQEMTTEIARLQAMKAEIAYSPHGDAYLVEFVASPTGWEKRVGAAVHSLKGVADGPRRGLPLVPPTRRG